MVVLCIHVVRCISVWFRDLEQSFLRTHVPNLIQDSHYTVFRGIYSLEIFLLSSVPIPLYPIRGYALGV